MIQVRDSRRLPWRSYRDTVIEATNKVITTDGWFKTGDLGYLDEENFLFIKDRRELFEPLHEHNTYASTVKDVIIRGGENIVRSASSCLRRTAANVRTHKDSVSVENALYFDDRILEAAAVGVPDERLGELVAAVVSIKPAFRGQVTEAELILRAQKRYSLIDIILLFWSRDAVFQFTKVRCSSDGGHRQPCAWYASTNF